MGPFDWLQKETAVVTRLDFIPFVVVCLCIVTGSAAAEDQRPHTSVGGRYCGVPVELLEHDTLQELGVNAIFMGADGISEERIKRTRQK